MTSNRIDIHHHILPPSYLAQERERILGVGPGFTSQLTEWSPARAVETMDRDGVATAMTSISSPGIWFGDVEQTRRLARECNDYAARLAADNPGRFGVFAALPLPDVEGSLREIEYAFEILKADGVGLMTNYGAIWPGDPELAAVFDELNRRRAVVYFHPVAAPCCVGLLSDIPDAIMEYPFDTTRAVASLLYSGTFSRCPAIRFIFSHGGGTIPMLGYRIARLADLRKDLAAKLPQGALHELKKLHYDVVSVTHPVSFNALRMFAGISQLLFGSDYPYWAPRTTSDGLVGLGLAVSDLEAIGRVNALRLLPQLSRIRR